MSSWEGPSICIMVNYFLFVLSGLKHYCLYCWNYKSAESWPASAFDSFILYCQAKVHSLRKCVSASSFKFKRDISAVRIQKRFRFVSGILVFSMFLFIGRIWLGLSIWVLPIPSCWLIKLWFYFLVVCFGTHLWGFDLTERGRGTILSSFSLEKCAICTE